MNNLIRVKHALALLMEMDPEAPLVIDQGDNHERASGLTVGWILGDPLGKFLVLDAEPSPEEVESCRASGLVPWDARLGRCVIVE